MESTSVPMAANTAILERVVHARDRFPAGTRCIWCFDQRVRAVTGPFGDRTTIGESKQYSRSSQAGTEFELSRKRMLATTFICTFDFFESVDTDDLSEPSRVRLRWPSLVDQDGTKIPVRNRNSGTFDHSHVSSLEGATFRT